MAAVGSELYLHGGYAEHTGRDELWMYPTTNGTWKLMVTPAEGPIYMPCDGSGQPCGGSAMAVVGDVLYLHGSTGHSTHFPDAPRADPCHLALLSYHC